MRGAAVTCQFGDELVILAVELVVLATSGWPRGGKLIGALASLGTAADLWYKVSELMN